MIRALVTTRKWMPLLVLWVIMGAVAYSLGSVYLRVDKDTEQGYMMVDANEILCSLFTVAAAIILLPQLMEWDLKRRPSRFLAVYSSVIAALMAFILGIVASQGTAASWKAEWETVPADFAAPTDLIVNNVVLTAAVALIAVPLLGAAWGGIATILVYALGIGARILWVGEAWLPWDTYNRAEPAHLWRDPSHIAFTISVLFIALVVQYATAGRRKLSY